MNESMQAARRTLGVIGGLGPLAGADVFFKLMKATPARGDAEPFDVVFEQHPFRQSGGSHAATTARKLYVFDMIRDFEKRGITTAALPCFVSHTFIEQLQENASLHIVDMLDALRAHLAQCFPSKRRIGVLTSDYLREQRLFERYFPAAQFDVLHPRQSEADGGDAVTRAVYDRDGIKSGNLTGRPVTLLRAACADLVAQRADVIVSGLTEIGLVIERIGSVGVPLIDANQVYANRIAHYVATGDEAAPARMMKIGVVGGVGPAATVDFIDKIVRGTPASRDQDHLKLLVEQNPQIPDRTGNLIGDGPDPTLSLYATCRKLEAGGADFIAIPCNTAHAFVERIQPYLNVPIVNMLTVTVDALRAKFPALREVGLLATDGTIASGVYRDAFDAGGFTEIVPGPAAQMRVMQAIYGARGVKAGFTSGECVDDIHAALDDLIARGVDVIVLGCTELPLLLPQGERRTASGRTVWLADPTDILAKRCIAYARGGAD